MLFYGAAFHDPEIGGVDSLNNCVHIRILSKTEWRTWQV